MRYTVEIDGDRIEVDVRRLDPDRFEVRIDQGPATIVYGHPRPGGVHLRWADQVHRIAVGVSPAGHLDLHARGRTARAQVLDERQRRLHARRRAGQDEGGGLIRSPMPGKIVSVLVQVGARVAADTAVVIVEAMKMENELRAGTAGIVRQLHVAAGDLVEANAELVMIEPREPPLD